MQFVSEQHSVVVDGFYKEEDDIVLVCKQDDVYSDYKCPLHALKELVGDEEEADAVIEGMIPFNAVIVVSLKQHDFISDNGLKTLYKAVHQYYSLSKPILH